MTIIDAGGQRTATIEALRARMRGLEAPDVATRGLPVPAALQRVLPVLRTGAVHSIESRSLALQCLAAAVPTGAWSAIVGMPDVGVEAAADLGIAVDRLVLVPTPGGAWNDAVASLAEVMPVVLAAGPARITSGEAARIEARLRAADACLIVHGAWPSPTTRIRSLGVDWRGTDAGLGRIARGSMELEVTGADGRPRRARMPIGGAA